MLGQRRIQSGYRRSVVAQNPNFNIGLATGKPSGFWVLDVDGQEAETKLASWEHQYSALPETAGSITRPGRRQLFFKQPDFPIPTVAGQVDDHIDTRGDGGYIVVPPSIHPDTDKPYRWNGVREIAEAPRWLLSLIVEAHQKTRTPDGCRPTGFWAELANNDVPEGARNNTLASVMGYLLSRRVEPLLAYALIHGLNRTQCFPPLSDKEVKKICDSIAARELKKRAAQ
jgi:Bifunctional DNA primase/polymerase, N-terminal/Primase C terminal 1 (PriCT-1)